MLQIYWDCRIEPLYLTIFVGSNPGLFLRLILCGFDPYYVTMIDCGFDPFFLTIYVTRIVCYKFTGIVGSNPSI